MPGRAAARTTVAVLSLLVAAAGAAPPDEDAFPGVLPVPIPAKRVAGFFGPDAPLRLMTAQEFDGLVGAAQARSRRGASGQARLVRARHSARFGAGLLTGRSELVVTNPSRGPSKLSLEPWSPAILRSIESGAVVGASASGKASLWLDPPRDAVAEATITLDWELRARPDSRGRLFTLALPGDETSTLTLDAPRGWAPSGPSGRREGPVAGPGDGRELWRFHGRPGECSLRLIELEEKTDEFSRPRIWVGGPTRIDLGATGETKARTTNYTTSWSVQADSVEVRELTAEIPPGIDLLGVVGPNVRDFRLGPRTEEGASRVTVALADGAREPSTVEFQAHVRAPIEGEWTVPSIRPLPPAVWTGGATSIAVDPIRTVRACRERNALRIPPTSSAEGQDVRFDFESFAPGPVADLTFRGAGGDSAAAAVVRGRLFVRQSSTRIECEIGGLGAVASASEYDVELPPNWILDNIQLSGADDVSWNQSARPDGGVLLRVVAPPGDVPAEGRTLTLGAASTTAPGRGPLALPRVRPVRMTIEDEAWVALVDEPTVLAPLSTGGLAWIDPAQVKGLLPSPSSSAELRPALGWRWTTDQAEAMIDRQRVVPERLGWIHLKARIEDEGRRLAIGGRITATGGRESEETLPIWIDLAPAAAPSCVFSDSATGRKLTTTPISDSARRALGLPRTGIALELHTGRPASGRTSVDFQVRSPWSGRGPVPLPSLPGSFAPRGVVVVELPSRMRSRVETEGLSRIEASLAGRLAPTPAVPTPTAAAPSSAYWTAHAFAYWKPGCKLELTTEELKPAPILGVVHDARLTTLVYPGGRWLNRLRAVVGADAAAAIPLRPPVDVELARVRVDGVDTAPVSRGGGLSIPPRARGARTRTIELDYYVKPGRYTDRRELRPAVPDLGLPCLSFGWDLVLPADWEVESTSPDLVVAARDESIGWPFGTLGFPRPQWPGRPPSPALGEEVVRALDEPLAVALSGEPTFSEWFIRWDSSPYPVVVDRLSLAAEGLGPKSPCPPTRRDPSGSSISLQTLRQNGLALVLVDDVVVVTSQGEAERTGAASAWRESVAEAVFWGADRTDRFQSATRWRGEASPSDPAAGGRGRLLPGWTIRRFSSLDWPGPGSHVRTIDRSSRFLPGWAVAVLLVLLGLKRGRSPRWGLVGPILATTAAVVLHDRTRFAPPWLSAGLFLGALVLLLIRLGRLLRTSLGRTHASRAPSPFLRRTGARYASFLAAVAAILSIPAALAAPEARKPIVVLIPYDGPYDPKAPPGRVVIAQPDYERLVRLASPPAPSAGEDLAILAAEHRVARSADREVAVVSEYTVRLGRGSTLVPFDFPVSDARDIRANVDGRTVPVVIAAGGERGTVALPGGGTVRLQIRRIAVPSLDGGSEVLDLSINPTPLARLTLEQPPGFRPFQHLGARGKVVTEGDQTTRANLGPVDRLQVSWTTDEPIIDRVGASVESIVLWDVDPAGERIRARLTYRPRRRLSTIEIAMEPGLVPREMQVPGLVDSSWERDGQGLQWRAKVDPPIQGPTTVLLDLWRPLQPQSADAEAKQGDPSGATIRRFPRVEPLGVEREAGLLAVRRPGHWTGRLEPARGADLLSDEGFVNAWGALPDDNLTFAGTARFNARDVVEFRTGPTPLRLRMKPSVQLRIDSGRIDCRFEAELTEISGLLDQLEFQVPASLVVLGVESEGMTDWSKPAGGPLRVRFDRFEPKSRRSIRIKGWIPVSELDPGAKPRRFRTPLPWIALPGAAAESGSLTIDSKTPADLPTTADGPTLLSTSAAEPGKPWSRQVFRVDDPARAGELRWSPSPPRVNVSVQSQLTIHPDSAEWVAILRYEVAGGSLDAIHLKVPSAWAERAQLRLTGQDYQLTTESRDSSTFWSITPERPIWGAQRLVLRSSIPLASEQELRFPEITPLGEGGVDGWLGLVMATASPLATEGSAGLRPIAYSSRFQAEEFGSAAGVSARGFHIEREDWWLKVQAPRRADAERRDGFDSARVKSADVTLVLAADGSVRGRASYQTEPRTGRFLMLDPPAGGVLSWATVDGAAVEPLLAEEGRWMIPLGEQVARGATIIWTEGPSGDPSAVRLLELPRAGTGQASTLAAVHLPADRILKLAPAGLEAIGSERVDRERADRIARRITESLAAMDRGSGRDRERLATLLIDHELALRSVEHALQAVSKRGVDRPRRDRAARELDAARASRAAVHEAVRSAGLDEQVESARAHLGLAARPAGSQAVGIPESDGLDRIRRLGKPTFLLGAAPGLLDPPVQLEAVGDGPAWYTGSSADRARSTLLLVLLLGLAATALAAPRLVGAQVLMIVACLALVGLAAGPQGLALAVAAVAAGWAPVAPARDREAVGPTESGLGSGQEASSR